MLSVYLWDFLNVLQSILLIAKRKKLMLQREKWKTCVTVHVCTHPRCSLFKVSLPECECTLVEFVFYLITFHVSYDEHVFG